MWTVGQINKYGGGGGQEIYKKQTKTSHGWGEVGCPVIPGQPGRSRPSYRIYFIYCLFIWTGYPVAHAGLELGVQLRLAFGQNMRVHMLIAGS